MLSIYYFLYTSLSFWHLTPTYEVGLYLHFTNETEIPWASVTCSRAHIAGKRSTVIWGLAQSLFWLHSRGGSQENGAGLCLCKSFRDPSFRSRQCPSCGEKLFCLLRSIPKTRADTWSWRLVKSAGFSGLISHSVVGRGRHIGCKSGWADPSGLQAAPAPPVHSVS